MLAGLAVLAAAYLFRDTIGDAMWNTFLYFYPPLSERTVAPPGAVAPPVAGTPAI